MPQKTEYVVLDLIDNAFRNAKVQPLNLGAIAGSGGGIGGPPGGIIGQLSQSRVTYDLSEDATLFTPASGMSLVDNLNHIRYRIGILESGGGTALTVQDLDGDPVITNVDTITFSGVVLTDLGAGNVLVQVSPVSSSGECVVIDDLTPQITTSGVHFDLQTEATCPSGVLLFYNGVYQSYSYFTVDEDALGLTTDFPTYSGDSLVAVYNFGGGGGSSGTGTDNNAIHDNVANEINVVTEKTNLHNDDVFIIEDSEASYAKKRAKKSNIVSGLSGWTQTLNETGSSFTNFTGTAGTWASDGTVIKQTNTAASFAIARYNNPMLTSLIVYQADIQIKSSGADRIGGLLIGYDGTTATAAAAIRLNQSGSAQVETHSLDARVTLSATINIDTWYTLRAVMAGSIVSVYLDGTLLGSGGDVQRAGNASYIGLLTYQAEVWFRNIKAWNLDLPA